MYNFLGKHTSNILYGILVLVVIIDVFFGEYLTRFRVFKILLIAMLLLLVLVREFLLFIKRK